MDKKVVNGKVTSEKWKGPFQYVDKKTGELMMLPSDMELVKDETFKFVVQEYAKDQDLFFKDFADAFGKLIELGVKRKPESVEPFHF